MGNSTAEATVVLGGALSHEFLHGGHGLGSLASATSLEDFDLLEGPGVLNLVESDVLLSGLGLQSATEEEWILESDLNFRPCDMLDPAVTERLARPGRNRGVFKTYHNVAPNTASEVSFPRLPEGSKADASVSRSMEVSFTHEECLPEQMGTSSMTKVKNKCALGGFTRHLDHSDNSDGMEEEEIEKVSPNGKTSLSKNLVSERRRRKKLNERLYSLRAIVPNISKMDKASIVGDAISYVQELKQQIEDMENDIYVLQSNQEAIQKGRVDFSLFHQSSSPPHKILELDVLEMEGHTFHLRIHCKKAPGALVQLTRAFETLDLEILNANLTSVGDHILSTIVVKVRNDKLVTPKELKEMIRIIAPEFNLELQDPSQ